MPKPIRKITVAAPNQSDDDVASGLDSDATTALSASASQRSLQLISELAKAGRAMSLVDLARQLALPKTTTHRLCQQLLACGFVTRDVHENFYTTGPALRTLALDTLSHGLIRGLSHTLLAELVAQINETCNFTTLDGTQILYLDRVEAHWPLRLSLEVGSHVPIHCTSSGKLLLSMLPAVKRDVLLKALNLTRMTRNTITSERALRAECNEIAARGYSTDNEEFMAGLIAVAVPVVDNDGLTRATIAVHAPLARMSLKAAIAKLPLLKDTAKRMSDLL